MRQGRSTMVDRTDMALQIRRRGRLQPDAMLVCSARFALGAVRVGCMFERTKPLVDTAFVENVPTAESYRRQGCILACIGTVAG